MTQVTGGQTSQTSIQTKNDDAFVSTILFVPSGAVEQLHPHDVVVPVVHLTNVKPELGQVLVRELQSCPLV
jgi:hypothetical protein